MVGGRVEHLVSARLVLTRGVAPSRRARGCRRRSRRRRRRSCSCRGGRWSRCWRRWGRLCCPGLRPLSGAGDLVFPTAPRPLVHVPVARPGVAPAVAVELGLPLALALALGLGLALALAHGTALRLLSPGRRLDPCRGLAGSPLSCLVLGGVLQAALLESLAAPSLLLHRPLVDPVAVVLAVVLRRATPLELLAAVLLLGQVPSLVPVEVALLAIEGRLAGVRLNRPDGLWRCGHHRGNAARGRLGDGVCLVQVLLRHEDGVEDGNHAGEHHQADEPLAELLHSLAGVYPVGLLGESP
mmetsp:Transcript_33782/g.104951  ORF Transcript_33782/g.104951 Transcript_33782/m.104951 type:complete len:298 (-) Transcript_33782:61-954(-)